MSQSSADKVLQWRPLLYSVYTQTRTFNTYTLTVSPLVTENLSAVINQSMHALGRFPGSGHPPGSASTTCAGSMVTGKFGMARLHPLRVTCCLILAAARNQATPFLCAPPSQPYVNQNRHERGFWSCTYYTPIGCRIHCILAHI